MQNGSVRNRQVVTIPVFVVNGHGVKASIGMSDIRLEAKVHIVTSAQSATDNIIKIVGCFKRAKLIAMTLRGLIKDSQVRLVMGTASGQ